MLLYSNVTVIWFCRACRLWSAPYDGIDPPSDESRSETPGDNLEDEEEIIQRGNSDSICSLAITPPPSALSPTPSSSDAGNPAGRASSAMELEWDDIFADDDSALVTNAELTNGGVTLGLSTPAPPHLPPRHIQEMRRTATKLVHGAYVEESEFQDDVLVYDLIAQKDSKAAILERMVAANRETHGNITNERTPATSTAAGRTVLETVNSIMSSRRRSEDAGKEERRRSEDCGRATGSRHDEEDDEKYRTELKGREFFISGFNTKNFIIDECEDADEELFKGRCSPSDFAAVSYPTQRRVNHSTQHPTHCSNALPNGHSEFEPQSTADAETPNPPHNKVTNNNNNDFLSQYHQLMLSLGVDPDCDSPTEDMSTFRRRVRALRRKLEAGEEEKELYAELVLTSVWDDGEEGGEGEAVMEEGEEEERSSRSNGVPFTGGWFQD